MSRRRRHRSAARRRVDPSATPPVVPTPNDLAFVGGDGMHLNVPEQPNDRRRSARSTPTCARSRIPRRLDGDAPFSARSIPASATVQTAMAPGSTWSSTPPPAALVAMRRAAVSADGKTLDRRRRRALAAGHRYAVLVFGGDDAAGLRAPTASW